MGATERKKPFSEIRLLTDRTEIAYEPLRISHALETFDMSDRSALAPDCRYLIYLQELEPIKTCDIPDPHSEGYCWVTANR